jgi:hypothetical protein
MNDEELSKLWQDKWMLSRIPVLPALCAFSPDALKPDPVIEETLRRISGRSRWQPVPGGLRVTMPYHGEPFDKSHFNIEPAGWDFDTCDVCEALIPAMTLCRMGSVYIICLDCYARHVVSKQHRPWWRFW